MNLRHTIFGMGISITLAAGVAHADCDPKKDGDVACQDALNVEVAAQSAGSFKSFLKAIKAAGLSETLTKGTSVTVFAPTDAAFAALPAGKLDALMKNKVALKSLLLRHIVQDLVPTAAARVLKEVTMADGKNAYLKVEGQTLFINKAKVIKSDIKAKNGFVHGIDAVMLP